MRLLMNVHLGGGGDHQSDVGIETIETIALLGDRPKGGDLIQSRYSITSTKVLEVLSWLHDRMNLHLISLDGPVRDWIVSIVGEEIHV